MGLCSLVLGTATMAAGGTGALACGVILGTSAGYVGGELSSSGGEAVGEFIYNSADNRMNSLTAILFILSTIVAFGYSTLKNKQHLLLCDAFRDKFGFLPGGITIAQAGGIFLAFQKDLFFVFPLIVNKENFIIRDMKPEHYEFIKNLPNEMTRWLKTKYSLFFITILFFILFLTSNFVFFKV